MLRKHVIVGGLGNVGRHLQRLLLDQGLAVTVVDRPPTANASSSSSAVEFVPLTLGENRQKDAEVLQTALADAETVYSVVTPDVQHGTVGEFEQTNHHGVKHLLQAAQDAGVSQFVYASSIAVTNHMVDSIQQDESHPLPSMDSYQTSYDSTKRQGEDAVLNANHDGQFRTCALRLGGILASPRDYYMRRNFTTGPQGGKIDTAVAKPIDAMAGWDVARALHQAAIKLPDDNGLAGRAVFCTKSKADEQDETPGAPPPHIIAEYVGEQMDWQVQTAPAPVLQAVQAAMFLHYQWQKATTSQPKDLPGMPFYKYMDVPNYEQTFDNKLAYQLLDFAPTLTWREAVDDIIKEYRSSR